MFPGYDEVAFFTNGYCYNGEERSGASCDPKFASTIGLSSSICAIVILIFIPYIN